jgi:hypothetical protein
MTIVDGEWGRRVTVGQNTGERSSAPKPLTPPRIEALLEFLESKRDMEEWSLRRVFRVP